MNVNYLYFYITSFRLSKTTSLGGIFCLILIFMNKRRPCFRRSKSSVVCELPFGIHPRSTHLITFSTCCRSVTLIFL